MQDYNLCVIKSNDHHYLEKNTMMYFKIIFMSHGGNFFILFGLILIKSEYTCNGLCCG